MRRSVSLLLIAFLALAFAPAPLPRPEARKKELQRFAAEGEPDTRKAQKLDRWPNEQDLAKLKSVEGQPKWKVIQVLGHPSGVERRPAGTEVWDYPWQADCRVWINNGVVTGTFYTAGW